MKRMMKFLLTGLMAVTMFSGCAGKTENDGKVSISMYVCDRSMFKELTPWLEEKFPDIDFTFVQSFNTMEYYKDLIERGEEMPDIITCRRFSLNDAASLSEYLMDMSHTDVAGTFYSSYLENNREESGAIRWLPMCAEVDSIVANKKLFDQHDIKLPTNYSEFTAAIDAFEQLGIKGFDTDWYYDYTCLETMQGSAIPELMSLEGTSWRRAYESETEGNQVGLDDVVWPVVFEKYEQFLKDVHFEKGSEEQQFTVTTQPFLNGETAMIRNTAAFADSVTLENENVEAVMLPYFGETSEDNWVLTYPMCQVAVSEKVAEDPAKEEAINEVLMAIFSAEGQKHVAAGTSVLSYNKEVKITPSNSLAYIQDCVASNHLYQRLASTEIFGISQDVAHKMMTGKYDAKQAYEEFNRQITQYVDPDTKEILFTQKTAYSNDFGEHGSAAASSLMNTLRQFENDDIAIGYASVASSSIYEGEYTLQQVKWVMTFRNAIYRGEYTGEEVRRIMEWLVNVKEDGSNPIRHYNQMPVTSGLEYTVQELEKGKYELKDISIQGEPLDENRTYSLMMVGVDTYLEHPTFCNCPMPEDIKAKREADYVTDYSSQEAVAEVLRNTKQFAAPTDYVTITK